MDMLQVREKEIFETLKKLNGLDFVVIGGYAVNTYTLPRFSIDCDIVIKDNFELLKIEKKLLEIGYKKDEESKKKTPYHGNFARYIKQIKKDFDVSVDILIKEVLDRQTNATFSSEWIFKNSKIELLKGKTILEELKIRIINIDALFVMKSISCRSTDIRDIFMIASNMKNKEWIKQEITSRYSFDDRFDKIKEKIESKQFKDNLQGIFGYIDNKIFEKHKKIILNFKQNNQKDKLIKEY